MVWQSYLASKYFLVYCILKWLQLDLTQTGQYHKFLLQKNTFFEMASQFYCIHGYISIYLHVIYYIKMCDLCFVTVLLIRSLGCKIYLFTIVNFLYYYNFWVKHVIAFFFKMFSAQHNFQKHKFNSDPNLTIRKKKMNEPLP